MTYILNEIRLEQMGNLSMSLNSIEPLEAQCFPPLPFASIVKLDKKSQYF